MARVLIFDVDGTLVDSTYHHALAWQRAFADCGIALPAWRLHRQIGKGGDQLVPDVAGEQVERRHGDRLRERHDALFAEMIGEVQGFDGVPELLADARAAGWRIALASSGHEEEVEHYVELLGIDSLLDARTSSADADASKPAPDIFSIAHERAGGTPSDASSALVVGDAPWDCVAARDAGMPMIGLLSGGFSACELRDAGVEQVFETVAEVRAAL
ncbi:MAG TPA: HAD family hydrolase [Conexibacter sp.]|jgi:HAD superfamily hydrolase (TIGR01509 family)